MRIQLVVLAGVIAIGLPQFAQAQTALSTDANRAVQITEARQRNAALMHQYTWTSRTEILDQGQVKDTRLRAGPLHPFRAAAAQPLERSERPTAPRLPPPGYRRE